MHVAPLAIDAVKLVRPPRHADPRGYLVETWNRETFAAAGITVDFVQDNSTYSARAGTIRGIHYQRPPRAQAKLVRVVRGAIFDVALDLRRNSATYGRHVAVDADRRERRADLHSGRICARLLHASARHRDCLQIVGLPFARARRGNSLERPGARHRMAAWRPDSHYVGERPRASPAGRKHDGLLKKPCGGDAARLWRNSCGYWSPEVRGSSAVRSSAA